LDWKVGVRLYRELGSFKAVAREMGCNEKTVALNLKKLGVRVRRHGQGADERTIRYAWNRMRRACDDPSDDRYPEYGARGIAVSRPWRDFEVFRVWALRHYEKGKVLVLLDREKDFSASNCRWVERGEMLRRRAPTPKRLVSAFGESKSITRWVTDPRCRVTLDGLRRRLDKGWHPEDAIRLAPYAKPPRTLQAPTRAERRKETDWAQVERLVLEEGLTRAEVARRLRIPKPTVYAYFQRNGIRVPSTPPRNEPEVRLAGVWRGMHQRAQQEGLRVTHGWKRFDAFRGWARANGYQRGKVLVRVDCSRGWSPANCRFVPKGAAVRYHKEGRKPGGGRPRWTVEAFGDTKGVSAWSRDRRCAVSLTTLTDRLRDGWEPEQAIAIPPQSYGRGPRGCLFRAFGESKTLSEWERDPRCVTSRTALRARLERGIPFESALTVPAWKLRE
jgi:transposase-like protein